MMMRKRDSNRRRYNRLNTCVNALPKTEDGWRAKRKAANFDTVAGVQQTVRKIAHWRPGQSVSHFTTHELPVVLITLLLWSKVEMSCGTPQSDVNAMLQNFLSQYYHRDWGMKAQYLQRLRAASLQLLDVTRRLYDTIGARSFEAILLHGMVTFSFRLFFMITI